MHSQWAVSLSQWSLNILQCIYIDHSCSVASRRWQGTVHLHVGHRRVDGCLQASSNCIEAGHFAYSSVSVVAFIAMSRTKKAQSGQAQWLEWHQYLDEVYTERVDFYGEIWTSLGLDLSQTEEQRLRITGFLLRSSVRRLVVRLLLQGPL